MPQSVLILGASGTVGKKLFEFLSRDEGLTVAGTYCSNKAAAGKPGRMFRFSVEQPQEILPILEQVHPDVVISALRGDFGGQRTVHRLAAEYLEKSKGRLFFLSTVNVFDGDRTRPHYETAPRISGSDYGNFKIQCEDLLLSRLGRQTAVIRIPFVWGKDSPRLQQVKEGCRRGRLEIYEDFFSNHVSDLQIAQAIHWMIREEKTGVFHVGTTEAVSYRWFMEQLIAAMDLRKPEFIPQKAPGTMAVLSKRGDFPPALQWSNAQILRYLGRTEG